LIEDIPEERISAYRRMIRESFAKKHSVFILIPEIAYAEKLASGIEKGIEEYLHIIHSGLTPKKQKEGWDALLKETHPVVIIGTGAFLSLPRTDIGLLIVDYESSRAYKMPSRPFIDIRIFATFFAAVSGAKLIFGSFPLRTETKHLVTEGVAREVSPFKHRISAEHPSCTVIDMRNHQEKAGGKNTPSTISKEFLVAIEKSVKADKRSLVFATRRGMHGSTVCADCGTVVLCPRCNAPLTLHKASGTKTDNIYQCHTCGHTETARDTCEHCGSWRVTTLGVGIEHVEEILKEHFPGSVIIRIDADTTNTPKKIRTALETWQSEKGSILLTTEMGLPYITHPADTVVVASLDTILSLPDYRGNERIVSILATLALTTKHTFIVQTRHPEHPAFSMCAKGSIAELYKGSIKERKTLGYPPFAVLVKITTEGTRSEEEIKEYREQLAEHHPLVYTGAPNIKGAPRTHMLLKIPSDTWPHPEIIGVLKTLPPSVTINVDPESVL
ncbi:MAG: primosomal protein N', partial [Parcubacteria group bacterium]|nr:primosomal protein N' [Parcubacteria group bacterium]